ncbi:MAG: ABC transporter permease [Bacteroidaceae bacterium]|nr:ABC transporter permease [Bacteroidaceae bacterium]
MNYIRQALAMMREEKLFSGIHIAGTALALAFTMVMAVVYYIKLAPIYPEPNRQRTVYLNMIEVQMEKDGKTMGTTSCCFSEKAFEEWLLPSRNYEYCAPTLAMIGSGRISDFDGECAVKGKEEYIEAITNYTNADFFKIYQYEFLEGRPLTEQDVENREKVCVVSHDFAERYFGRGVSAVGGTLETENREAVRVVGVVRGTSSLTPDSHIQVFKPYTLRQTAHSDNPYCGSLGIVLTVKDGKQLQALKRELDEIAARLTQSEAIRVGWMEEGATRTVRLTNAMETHPMHTLRNECSNGSLLEEVSTWQVVKHYAGLLFILLFVPALNLCGIVAGRMERRTAEMAVRKTFGARRSALLWQVIMENLVLTGIGGLIGLVVAWLSIYAFRSDLLGLFFDSSAVGSSPIVTGEMLFAPLLFVGAFLAILIINLLSALLPAWLSLRKPIVESMMEKR